MFKCHVCGSTASRDELLSEVFTVDDRRVLVERIPGQVCERCGEPTFSSATTEKVRRLVHGEGRPVRTVPLDVFAMV
jgi:HTH-type transcriptional regulator/antitoxin MqsA